MSESSAILNHEPGAAPRPELENLLSRLELSLHAGQRALLLRDLERFEEQTALQESLSKVLVESLRDWTPREEKLRAACLRVMQLCRVQLGLLRRAQRSLRVLSNLLAGAEATYLPVSTAQEIGCRNVLSAEEG